MRYSILIGKRRTVFIGVLAALLLAGCSANVRMDPVSIPEPLVNTIPMTIGLRMPENFHQFTHTEEVVGGEEWQIDLGRANAEFFEQLFGYIFESVIIIGPEDDPAILALDALIEPSIDAFEFSVPNQTKTDSFAVWIRYRLKVYNTEGVEVADWPVAAYGKSLTTTMGGKDALQRAAILAMRDAAALLVIRFDEQELVSSLAGNAQSDGAEDSSSATVQKTSVGGENNE